MTHKFKFGDRVHYETDTEEVFGFVVREDRIDDLVIVQFNNEEYPVAVRGDKLKIIPHPDTVRLDYIERVINIDGMIKREMRKGWVLVDGDIELNTPEPLLRDAIDEAMHLTTGNRP